MKFFSRKKKDSHHSSSFNSRSAGTPARSAGGDRPPFPPRHRPGAFSILGGHRGKVLSLLGCLWRTWRVAKSLDSRICVVRSGHIVLDMLFLDFTRHFPLKVWRCLCLTFRSSFALVIYPSTDLPLAEQAQRKTRKARVFKNRKNRKSPEVTCENEAVGLLTSA